MAEKSTPPVPGVALVSFDDTAVDALIRIEERVSFSPWSHRDMQASLNANHLCLALQSGGSYLGYAVFSKVVDEAELLLLGVAPDWQRKGLAAWLLEEAIARHLPQVNTLYLEVRESNHPAIALYEKLGFNEVGVRPNYYPSAGGREDALIYARQLCWAGESLTDSIR